MTSRGKLWTLAVLTAVLLLGLALRPYVLTAAFLLDVGGRTAGLRAWLPVQRYPLATQDLQIPTRHGAIEARVHDPVGTDAPTVLVFPGVHRGGVGEPRLVRLCAGLAATGYRVLCLPLPDLRAFRITSASTDMIEDAVTWVTRSAALAPTGRVGLVGVSFAGGLALVAAGRPSIADRLDVVVSIGGYGSLDRLLRYLCTGRVPDGRTLAPHDYGLAVAVLAAGARLVPPDQAEGLARAVRSYLEASVDDSPGTTGAAMLAQARTESHGLPEPARSLMQAVLDRNVVEVGRRVEPFVGELAADPALSPESSPAASAPAFLIHGSADNVIPAEETVRAASYLAQQGNRQVTYLLTPALSHADVQDRLSIAAAWRLLRFWTSLRESLP